MGPKVLGAVGFIQPLTVAARLPRMCSVNFYNGDPWVGIGKAGA